MWADVRMSVSHVFNVTTRDGAGRGMWFDWLMTGLAGWIVLGLFVDGWAHTHGQVDESFFTPFHGLLYSGLLATFVTLSFFLIVNRTNGVSWRQALPAGYGLSLVGALIFAAGGAGDFVWHELFGIEENVEALLSPTHLTLFIGIGLIASGPLRAAWQRAGVSASLKEHLPMLTSLGLTLSVATFVMQIAHPIPNPYLWAGRAPLDHATLHTYQELGVVSLLLNTNIVIVAVLLVVRRWQLPLGAFTIVFTLNALAMSALYDGNDYVTLFVAGAALVIGAVGGIAADVLYRLLQPSPTRPAALRLFAGGVPVLMYGAYFVVIGYVAGIWWSVHLWAGSIVMAGLIGVLLSYLIQSPAIPVEEPGV